MRELGWIEDSNLIIEARFADGHIDRLPALAKELIQRKVDVIFTYSVPGARAAKDATSTTPIVAVMADPVGSGLVASLSHPDGNLTGVPSAWDEGRGGKWLELLQDAIPGLSTAAVIAHPEDAFYGMAAKQLKAAAATRGVKLRFIDVRESAHLERAFELARRQAQAVIVVPGPFTNEHREEILALAARFQLPDLYGVVENGKLGGFIAYGTDSGMMYRHAAEYVDKVLKGRKAWRAAHRASDAFFIVCESQEGEVVRDYDPRIDSAARRRSYSLTANLFRSISERLLPGELDNVLDRPVLGRTRTYRRSVPARFAQMTEFDPLLPLAL
jgi:putative tryptophan/tyrosine transport system substrate-binding protein